MGHWGRGGNEHDIDQNMALSIFAALTNNMSKRHNIVQH